MRYSLVNATALGFDLVRLPGGARTAEVLVAACDVSPAELQALAEVHPGPDRELRWAGVRDRCGQRRPVLSAAELSEPALTGQLLDGSGRGAELLTRIASAPLGDLDALSQFVRREALEHTWTMVGGLALQDFRAQLAGDVLVDAATSVYCADLLDEQERRHLVTPYLQVRRPTGPTPDGELAGLVGPLLADLASWGPVERTAFADAVDSARSTTSRWAGSMHEAGWAAHLCGRTRIAAVAQLHAVVAFSSAGFTTREAALGAWNALSGVVQALVVSDLLAGAELEALLRPWVLATGHDPRDGRS